MNDLHCVRWPYVYGNGRVGLLAHWSSDGEDGISGRVDAQPIAEGEGRARHAERGIGAA